MQILLPLAGFALGTVTETKVSPPATISSAVVDHTAETNFESIGVINTSNTDYQTLLNAELFTYGSIGYPPSLPETIKAFHRLLAGINARLYFIDLEQNATNEGKLYALCGIYHTDFNLYQSLMGSYTKNTRTVHYMQGCMGSTQIINHLINSGNSPYYDMPDFLNGEIPRLILRSQ